MNAIKTWILDPDYDRNVWLVQKGEGRTSEWAQEEGDTVIGQIVKIEEYPAHIHFVNDTGETILVFDKR